MMSTASCDSFQFVPSPLAPLMLPDYRRNGLHQSAVNSAIKTIVANTNIDAMIKARTFLTWPRPL